MFVSRWQAADAADISTSTGCLDRLYTEVLNFSKLSVDVFVSWSSQVWEPAELCSEWFVLVRLLLGLLATWEIAFSMEMYLLDLFLTIVTIEKNDRSCVGGAEHCVFVNKAMTIICKLVWRSKPSGREGSPLKPIISSSFSVIYLPLLDESSLSQKPLCS